MTTSPPRGAAPKTSRGGEIGAAIRRFDWSQTAVGPREGWPGLLRSTLSQMLESPESLYLLWGPQMQFFFNDAYRPVLGPRLANALGQTIQTLWADAWPDIQPMVEQAFLGYSCRHEDLPVNMQRYPGEELTWWSFSMSPVYDLSLIHI